MSDKKNERQNDGAFKIVVGIAKIVSTVLSIFYLAVAESINWNLRLLARLGIYTTWLCLFSFGPRWGAGFVLGKFLLYWNLPKLAFWVDHVISKRTLFLFLFGVSVCVWLFFSGIGRWIGKVKAQRALDNLGLKSPTGQTPKLIRIIELGDSQKKIFVNANGFDLDSFRLKKGTLESSLNAIVQDVKATTANRGIFEILISNKELPKLVSFDGHLSALTRPYTFLIGQSMDRFLTADICDIHHLLVAGATGGGKSVFFKQAIVGLLQSSSYIQMYLVDLKGGVEVKPFAPLKNVTIAKDEATAITMLRAVVSEMERRFKFLEKNGYSEINPERDNLDRIVVAIDEASVLFTVSKTSKSNRDAAYNARELTDSIAKLGRAAGIHLILATQKVIKETIDTKVQTNINAKMCFRVNNIASSMTVLNNKKAAELPNIKGRGIWSLGSEDITVQVPKLDETDVKECVDELVEKFNQEKSPLKQQMLQIMAPKKQKSTGLVVSIDDEIDSD